MALRSSRAYGTYTPQASRPRTPPLPDVLLEELDRALAGLVRARLVERAALVAREAVARRVHVLLEVRVILLDLLPVLLGDGRVGLAPVEDHRTLRLLRRRVADAAAVVRDRRRHAVDARRGQPGHGAAEAVADHADLEAGLLRFLDRRAAVLHLVVDRQLAAHVAAMRIDDDRVRVTKRPYEPEALTGQLLHENAYVVGPMTSGPLAIRSAAGDEIAQLTVGAPY